MHKDFDHQGLAGILRGRDRWILSYNDCQQIRSLYADYLMQTPTWMYGMSNDKKSKELLILSKDLLRLS